MSDTRSKDMTDLGRAIHCLERLAPWRADDRDQWLRVGMALHNVSDDLFDAWDRWSQQSEKYNRKDMRTTWRSFKAGDGITLGSLIAWANEDDTAGAIGSRTPRPTPRPRPAPSSNSGPKRVFSSFEAAVQALEQQTGGKHEHCWTYRRADGTEALCVERLRIPSRTGQKPKTYRPLHPVAGGYALGDPEGLLPLYNLPTILKADTVAVFEGEKLCDLAAGIALVATTSAHGAQSALRTDWAPLAGKVVTIYPDHDKDGERYAQDVAAILGQLTPPSVVHIVDLPGLAHGEDFEQWLAPQNSQGSETIRAALQALPARQAPAERQDAQVETGPVLVSMASVEPKEIQWLWPGRVAIGRITLLVGAPGEGKSFVSVDAAARVSTGTPWPDGTRCPKGSAILISAEDDPADTIRPRLDAHYADVRKIHLLTALRRVERDGKSHEVMFTLADVAALETSLKSVPDCRLIVIDPIGSFLGGRTDSNRDNEVRSVLAPVAMLASKYGVALLVVMHRRKGFGGNADETALGSRAFTGIARSVWHVSRDPNNATRRLFTPGKNNLAVQGDGLAFTIIGRPIGRVTWEKDPVRMSADEALAAEAAERSGRPGPAPEKRSEAVGWLGDLLADRAMRVGNWRAPEPGTIAEAAKDAGYSWATIRRAKDDLGIKPRKDSDTGCWMWGLPEDAQDAQDASDSENLSILSPFDSS